VAALPPASFLDEVAEVERQRVLVQRAESMVINQQRMLDLLQSMPNDQVPAATIPHEQEVLKQKQQELDQARAEMQVAEGKLAQAQQERQYQEYLHSLEMSKRAISIQQAELQHQDELQRQEEQERDRSFKLAQLETQMQQLDTQLFSLSAVRSPYDGEIQRVVWKQQNDQNLIVELVLVANASSRSEGSRSNDAAAN
jgi:DNA repair exonuclease SbcCD ATPase subunit